MWSIKDNRIQDNSDRSCNGREAKGVSLKDPGFSRGYLFAAINSKAKLYPCELASDFIWNGLDSISAARGRSIFKNSRNMKIIVDIPDTFHKLKRQANWLKP